MAAPHPAAVADQVARQAAAGDVANARPGPPAAARPSSGRRPRTAAGARRPGARRRRATPGRPSTRVVTEQHASGQRVPVRAQSGRRQPSTASPGRTAGRRGCPRARRRPLRSQPVRRGAGTVLGHLATDQRAPGLATAVGHAAHEGLDDGRLDPGGGDVVEEQEWVCALDGDVVHAHRDQVDADGVEAAGGHGDERSCRHRRSTTPARAPGTRTGRRRESRTSRCRRAPPAGTWTGPAGPAAERPRRRPRSRRRQPRRSHPRKSA